MTHDVEVELILDYCRDWDPGQRCWRLPDLLRPLARSVVVALDGEDVPPDKVELRDGCVYWKDDTQPVGPDASVVGHLALAPPAPARWPWALALLAGLALVVGSSLATYQLAARPQPRAAALPGQPLAAYDFYPVVADDNGQLRLDPARFTRAVRELLARPDPRAASELVYLGQRNGVNLLLGAEDLQLYGRLSAKYAPPDPTADEHREQLFRAAARIVDGVGETFSGTGIEVVLHDTSNPLQSIRAVQNTISDRHVHDPTTNFGLRLIGHYAHVNGSGASYIAYRLPLKKDKRVIKASTIPLYDDRFGLYGFVCLNVDTSKLSPRGADPETARFLEAFCMTRDNPVIDEIIENSQHHREPPPPPAPGTHRPELDGH